MVNCILIITE